MAKYISKTHVCLNVVTPSGANVHVSFTERTGDGSVYYTNDPELIVALESHPRYGRLFIKDESFLSVKAPVSVKSEPAAVPEKKAVTKEFSNNEDAKDYFAEKFGVSRSKLRTRAAIDEAAKSFGVTVIWKE